MNPNTGQQDVFWKGSGNGHLWHGVYQSPGAMELHDLGMGAIETPSATAGAGTEYVFWRGGDGRLGEALQNAGGSWRGPLDLGIGPITQPTAAVNPNTGEQDVFWRDGGTGHLREAVYRYGAGWSGALDLKKNMS